MAWYSEFVFKLPKCPTMYLPTRYGILMETDRGQHPAVPRTKKLGYWGSNSVHLSKVAKIYCRWRHYRTIRFL